MAVDAVMPIFRAAVDAAEQHILRMHVQDFGGAQAPAVAGPRPTWPTSSATSPTAGAPQPLAANPSVMAAILQVMASRHYMPVLE